MIKKIYLTETLQIGNLILKEGEPVYLDMNKLFENILDPVQDTLNPEFWDDDQQLKSEIKNKILDIVKDSGVTDYDGIFFLGSSTSYNYTEDSDIDIHIIISDASKEEADGAFDKLPVDEYIGDHIIQFYVELEENFTEGKGSVYNIEKDEWVTKPVKPDTQPPFEYAAEVARIFVEAINSRVQEYEMDILELEFLHRANIKDKENRIAGKESEIRADLDSIFLVKNILYAMRTSSYAGEEMKFLHKFGMGNASLQNMVYKMLERAGCMELIKKYMAIRKQIGLKGFDTIREYEKI